MNANAPKSHIPSGPATVHDAWETIDPGQADVPAALQALRDQQVMPAAAHETERLAATATCAYCCEALSPADTYCPRCLRKIAGAARQPDIGEVAPPPPRRDAAVPQKSARTGDAIYALESPTRCPQCEQEIRSIRVIRVLRTQVSFTSTLPRKGYVIVCPECERLLSAELSGLI